MSLNHYITSDVARTCCRLTCFGWGRRKFEWDEANSGKPIAASGTLNGLSVRVSLSLERIYCIFCARDTIFNFLPHNPPPLLQPLFFPTRAHV